MLEVLDSLGTTEPNMQAQTWTPALRRERPSVVPGHLWLLESSRPSGLCKILSPFFFSSKSHTFLRLKKKNVYMCGCWWKPGWSSRPISVIREFRANLDHLWPCLKKLKANREAGNNIMADSFWDRITWWVRSVFKNSFYAYKTLFSLIPESFPNIINEYRNV